MKAPADVLACGANADVDYCDECIDAYRNGIEPGETACDRRAHTWLVRWEINATGANEREAAEQALAIQRDPASDALIFAVQPEDDSLAGWTQIDLLKRAP